ncbi:MAG: hypothetical protein QF531_02395 [Candidatus Poseidonia sp.]|jgi:hypothetical protein|nr:hypothetical protein [Poseidonia sp.]
MRQHGLKAALMLFVLLASTSGCMGLIAARESMEHLRDPAFESLNEKKITTSHEFVLLSDYADEFSNRSTFVVDEQTTEILVYFRAKFDLSDSTESIPGLGDLILDNTSHYVRATLTDSNGAVQWEEDVSDSASPPEEILLPTPSFPQGEWELEVKARGGGWSDVVTRNDQFLIIVTVISTCIQYPLVEDCS